ncbi:PREDICTED: uncharacterized protein LOC105973069 [Erythranthe guttata]|nr:PREDICTED: uncharacterized protein LOC105973069 [Erythranthe guttata]|eukprot:XP_012853527.1 PREDICTED: uncharacterized protein LOC105973069 [Erythranthe guttata]
MAVNSGEECENIHSNVVLHDGGSTNLQYESPSNITYLAVPNLVKTEMCLNAEPNLQNHTTLEVDKVSNCVPCFLDVDIEKGKAEIAMPNEESTANSKSDDSLARVLQREICLQIGGKFMQLLMNHGTELPKFASRERLHDTPTNRSRKYKRSASFNSSFNSRRVVLLFSVLSSMGTIILSYRTLRVRQIGDGSSGNV